MPNTGASRGGNASALESTASLFFGPACYTCPISVACVKAKNVGVVMNLVRLGLICFLLTPSAFGQLTARNPVDELKDQAAKALADAKVPFTPEQEKQLALLIEEERQAAENLFGVTWDFSKG